MIGNLDLDTTTTTTFLQGLIPLLLTGLMVTIAAAMLGYVIALILGLVLAVLRRLPYAIVTWPIAIFVEFVRDTPLLIQLFFLYYVLPRYGIVLPAFITGAAAIGVQYSTYTSEVFRAGIDAVARGQWEAAKALNLSMSRTYGVIVIPQAIPRVIPALGNLLVGILKETPILSTISVLEMLNVATIVGDRTYQYSLPLTLAAGLMLVTTSFFALIVRLLEQRLPKTGIHLQ
jgi:polar amino acid transport system permease protein